MNDDELQQLRAKLEQQKRNLHQIEKNNKTFQKNILIDIINNKKKNNINTCISSYPFHDDVEFRHKLLYDGIFIDTSSVDENGIVKYKLIW